MKSVNLGIIGCGYWGPNLVRNFSSLANCNVKVISDENQSRLDHVKIEFPFLKVSSDYMQLIDDKEIDAICIATPVKTHSEIAEQAINAGKHVFVEKPMAASIEEAKSMLELAKKFNKKLAVGHVFQFAPAVRKIKELISKGAIGEIFHIMSSRINLGPPKTDVDVIWDLGPHDFSIVLYLLDEFPKTVKSVRNFYPFGFSSNDISKHTNNANIDLTYESGKSVHIHLSWLSANKNRLMQVFGSEGTIVYDEMLALDGKVKLYGKGIDNRINASDIESKSLSYQSGDVHIIQLEQHEPLRMECQHFIESIINDMPLINGPEIGLDVVTLLSMASH